MPQARILMGKEKSLILSVLLLLPNFVLANAGSPMMWFGFLHLVWINAIIGIYESNILTSKFNIANRKWLIIFANYVSMFIGLYFIAPHFSELSGNTDFWGGKTRLGEYELDGFLIGMGISFIATLIIEFPFYLLAIKQKMKDWSTIKPFIFANLITNVIMFIIYFIIVSFGAKWN